MTAIPLLAAAAVRTLSSAPPVTPFFLILFIIFCALVFDFLNGFHDAANSIATVVSTRVLTPNQAVLWAAFFNFVAAFVFGTGVAATIAKGLVHPNVVDPATGREVIDAVTRHPIPIIDAYVVFGGLLGAIVWNILTWILALPTSSSHALVSGIAGAAVAKAGFGAIIIGKGWGMLLLFIVLSPTIGFLLGAVNMIVVAWAFRRSTPHKVDSLFRRLQLLSAGVYSLGHGGNDAQKTMGIIVMLLTAAGHPEWGASRHTFLGHEHNVSLWVILSCHAAIALGTAFGGWRIVKTMGSGITRLQPVGGFCAELSAATTIIGATFGHVPISTTHAITGSILGVGTTRGVRSVRWIWGQRIVLAWILTIPCAAFVAAITYLVVNSLLRPLVAGF